MSDDQQTGGPSSGPAAGGGSPAGGPEPAPRSVIPRPRKKTAKKATKTATKTRTKTGTTGRRRKTRAAKTENTSEEQAPPSSPLPASEGAPRPRSKTKKPAGASAEQESASVTSEPNTASPKRKRATTASSKAPSSTRRPLPARRQHSTRPPSSTRPPNSTRPARSARPPISSRPPISTRAPGSTRPPSSDLPPPSNRSPRTLRTSSGSPPSSRPGRGDGFDEALGSYDEMPTRRMRRTGDHPPRISDSDGLAPPEIPSLQAKPAAPKSSKPSKKKRSRRGKAKRRTVTIPDDNVPVTMAPSTGAHEGGRAGTLRGGGSLGADVDMTPTAKLPDAGQGAQAARRSNGRKVATPAVTILRPVSVTSSLPAVPSALPETAISEAGAAKQPLSSRESLPVLEVEPASVPTLDEAPPPPRRRQAGGASPGSGTSPAPATAGAQGTSGGDEYIGNAAAKRPLPPPRSIQPPAEETPAFDPATPASPPPPTSPAPPPAARKAPAKAPKAAAKPPTRAKRDWWVEMYGEDMLRTQDNPRQRDVELDVDFMLKSLELAPGSNILDLACGAGVHAVEIASRGYQVVGMDLSPVMLKLARGYNESRSQQVSFLESDMRQLNLDGVCDGIVCWSASFGYFDDASNEDVLKRMGRALRPGGRLLIDLPNRDHTAANSPSMAWFEKRGAVCMDEMRFDFKKSRLMGKRMVMFDDGRSRELGYDMRLYALHEAQQLLERNGFRVLEVSGHRAHRGAFFGMESERLLILAARVE